MSPEEAPISLNLTKPADSAAAGVPVPVEQLQFRQAEPVSGQTSARRCAVCKMPIPGVYFQAAGVNLCPGCAERVRAGQQAPPVQSLLKAAVYGGGAAIAGCAIYATVAIAAHLELALIAILIGYMVGRAVRVGSNGLGGRPQQILAVVLTYFAITFSYVVVAIYALSQQHAPSAQGAIEAQPAAMSLGGAIATLVVLAAGAPFLQLQQSGAGGLLSLLIIFFGLQRAWRITGRRELEIFGPYEAGDNI